jgi:hypothetical protein
MNTISFTPKAAAGPTAPGLFVGKGKVVPVGYQMK